jgi:NAD-dependent isocitrate dehydrogenase
MTTTRFDPATAAGGTTPIPAVLIEGDGIGPEIARAVRTVFEAAGVPIVWELAAAGLGCVGEHPSGLPPATLDAVRRVGVALKGPTETPVGGGHKSVNVTLRKALDLHANVRPVKSLPGAPREVDLVIVRENIEDLYAGIEHCQTPDVVQCLKVITRPGCEAVIRHAFALARAWGRKRVTCVHKANIMKLSDGLFLDVFRTIAAEYPDITADDVIIDAACMKLVMNPAQFDVLVLPNLYGDIVSDLAAGLIGGLGLAPGANMGDHAAVFEAVHGTAPDLAGLGLANPTALLLSGTQMLRHVGLADHAARIEAGIEAAIAAGVRTRDLGGSATTDAYVAGIIERLPASAHASSVATRVVPHAAPPAPAASAAAPWELRGLDLFVRHDGLPAMPEQVGSLRLRLISNRGTKVWPGPVPAIRLVDWHRCRYLAEGAITDADVLSFLGALGPSIAWMHVEKLHYAAGEPQFTKAQGE